MCLIIHLSQSVIALRAVPYLHLWTNACRLSGLWHHPTAQVQTQGGTRESRHLVSASLRCSRAFTLILYLLMTYQCWRPRVCPQPRRQTAAAVLITRLIWNLWRLRLCSGGSETSNMSFTQSRASVCVCQVTALQVLSLVIFFSLFFKHAVKATLSRCFLSAAKVNAFLWRLRNRSPRPYRLLKLLLEKKQFKFFFSYLCFCVCVTAFIPVGSPSVQPVKASFGILQNVDGFISVA